jgi:hypothetical protein
MALTVDKLGSNLDKALLSDKLYWHGYIPFYESFFASREIKNIAEFGVYKGNSIRWLLEKFPEAKIYGADILPLQLNWPTNERFTFTQLDQSSVEQVQEFLRQKTFDLIIEDGSHLVKHQINCIIEGLENLSSNGIYILEDVQTARRDHIWWKKPKLHWWKFREKRQARALLRDQGFGKGNVLHLLLALDHYQRIGIKIDGEVAKVLAENSLFTVPQIEDLASKIKSIHLYQRNHLPDMCHHCGAVTFDYVGLKCSCGQEIFSDADSMSFVVIRR